MGGGVVTAGNAHNLFRQQSFNTQIETLLDEITAYNPAMAGEDDAMLWDIPEFTGELGEADGDVAADASAPWKVGRTASVGMISRTFSAGKQQGTRPPVASTGKPPDNNPTKQAWPGNVGPCAVCGLVAAEISCHECRQNTCAFCDFQTHKNMATSHTARVSLRPVAAHGAKPEWSATIALTNKNGKRPQTEPRLQAQAQQNLGRTMSAELMGGGSLDDAILDFFRTDEFSDAVCKAGMDPQGFPSQSEIDMFSDYTALPIMDVQQRPAKMSRTTTRVQRATPKAKAKAKAKPKAATKASRPAAPKARSTPKARPTKARPAPKPAAPAPAAPPIVMEATPRPVDFQFQLDPTAATATGFKAIRLAAVNRFHRKREKQKLNPTVRYKSRKKIADNRPRIKGRFVKTENLVRAS